MWIFWPGFHVVGARRITYHRPCSVLRKKIAEARPGNLDVTCFACGYKKAITAQMRDPEAWGVEVSSCRDAVGAAGYRSKRPGGRPVGRGGGGGWGVVVVFFFVESGSFIVGGADLCRGIKYYRCIDWLMGSCGKGVNTRLAQDLRTYSASHLR